jgi:hypothetical protein
MTGGTPTASIAGNEKNVPPPATELTAPARKPATTMMTISMIPSFASGSTLMESAAQPRRGTRAG